MDELFWLRWFIQNSFISQNLFIPFSWSGLTSSHSLTASRSFWLRILQILFPLVPDQHGSHYTQHSSEWLSHLRESTNFSGEKFMIFHWLFSSHNCLLNFVQFVLTLEVHGVGNVIDMPGSKSISYKILPKMFGITH